MVIDYERNRVIDYERNWFFDYGMNSVIDYGRNRVMLPISQFNLFFLRQLPLVGGVAFIITFPILFYFISFCRLLPSPAHFSILLFWNLFAGLTLNGRLKMPAR